MTPSTAALFDALGDPTRRAIVNRIALGPVSVSALAAPLGISLTAVGQHLRLLQGVGLVRSEKHGRTRTCTFRPEGLHAIEDWASACRNDWDSRLDRLGVMLDELSEDQV